MVSEVTIASVKNPLASTLLCQQTFCSKEKDNTSIQSQVSEMNTSFLETNICWAPMLQLPGEADFQK